MTTDSQDIFIGRQPILDRNQGLYAYELLFRRSLVNNAQVTDDVAATATVLTHVFSELGLETALGPYIGFVNLDATMLMSDVLEILPRERFVLEVLETVKITPDILQRCRKLKDLGFKLALDDFVTLEESYRPMLELADIVKVDVLGMDQQALSKTAQLLRAWPVRLLAEKVDNQAQVTQCRELGFELFQGYFFAKPTVISGKKLSQSELPLLRLLGLILGDAETAEIEGIFKQEPGLSLNLIRLTNSAALSLPQRIVSLRHAITVLGRRQLQRWLQLLLYTSSSASGNIANPLLQLAATRGRLMELLAGAMPGSNGDQEDHAFMTGIMSLMPALLQLPMEEILKSLPLAPSVRDALAGHQGQLGRLLALTEALEQPESTAYGTLIAQLPGLNAQTVNASLTQALAWASSIGRDA